MSAAYRYDEKNEAPFEKQLCEMIEYRNIPYCQLPGNEFLGLFRRF